jgi:hypothetical protein
MIGNYANQSVTLKSVSSIDEYGQATYATPTIAARYEYSRKIVKDGNGKDVISEARCFTATAVKPDDVITFDGKDWIVISVSNIYNLEGVLKWYEVRL